MSRYHKQAGWTRDVVLAVRSVWTLRMKEAEAKGEPYICPKCKKPVLHTERWDVGHQMNLSEGGNALDLTNTTPEHMSCNRAEGARITNAIKQANRGRTRKWL